MKIVHENINLTHINWVLNYTQIWALPEYRVLCQKNPQVSDFTQLRSVYVSTIYNLCIDVRYSYFHNNFFFAVSKSRYKIVLSCANYRSTDSNPTWKEMYFDCRNECHFDNFWCCILNLVPLTPCWLSWNFWLMNDCY